MTRQHPLASRARGLVGELLASTRRLFGTDGALLLPITFVIWFVEASVYLTLAEAVGIRMDPLDAVYVVVLVGLFVSVPAAPGYVGTYDAAVIFGPVATGAPDDVALDYVLLVRFVLFVPITLVGIGIFVARYGGWSRYQQARLETRRS